MAEIAQSRPASPTQAVPGPTCHGRYAAVTWGRRAPKCSPAIKSYEETYVVILPLWPRLEGEMPSPDPRLERPYTLLFDTFYFERVAKLF